MRISILFLLVMSSSLAQAQGFLDTIRKRVNDTVNDAVEEIRSDDDQGPGESNGGAEDDTNPTMPANDSASASENRAAGAGTGNSSGAGQGTPAGPLFWGTPSGNTRRAIEQEIQGLRVGMPVIRVDQILQERGYERTGSGQYFKRETNADGFVVRTQRIRYLAVEPSQEFIDELDEPALKDMVLAAQREIRESQQTGQNSVREARLRGSRQSVARSSLPRNLELVYLILYEQIYNQDFRQFDLDASIAQVRSAFGPSTLPDDGLRRGMAFNLSPQAALIYHDASLLPDDYKNSLVEAVPNSRPDHKEAIYNALRAPCGGPENPWGPPGGGGCPPGWIDAFPDDISRQMEVAKAVLSPYMRIKSARSGAGIETRLEWSYLQSERGMRERFAEKAARESAPAAELDF